jgi:hypothetical protein
VVNRRDVPEESVSQPMMASFAWVGRREFPLSTLKRHSLGRLAAIHRSRKNMEASSCFVLKGAEPFKLERSSFIPFLDQGIYAVHDAITISGNTLNIFDDNTSCLTEIAYWEEKFISYRYCRVATEEIFTTGI